MIPNTLPIIEYETKVKVVSLNNYTYINELTLNPLPVKYHYL